jgi:uncharacterized FAD-dependent dehydrogenase
MSQLITLKLPPEIAYDESALERELAKVTGIESPKFRLARRSVDARSRKQIWVNLSVDLLASDEPIVLNYDRQYPNVSQKDCVIIIGAGPAGMFAAMRLIELGMKPIIIERGSDVRARRRDLAAINKDQIVNPESNYCFGEGGAGTYSDGKLYTRSKKRGDIHRILEIFVAHGATTEILVDAHPHIGTNKLPQIIQSMRESILSAGGEIHFNTKMVDLILKDNTIKGIKTQKGDSILGNAVLLATGHSSHDVFELLHNKKISIAAKPFALGVRIEHPQQLIDKIQYHCEDRGNYLPPSSYSLVHQAKYKGIDRGVFSFCMCPGGFIVPAATSPGEIVVNGMSPSRRNSKYANSGIVVSVELTDIPEFESYGPLAALKFQQSIEQKAAQLTGGGQIAPAQLMTDFISNKTSSELRATSYQPGLMSVDMQTVLPPFISDRLKEGLKSFGQKMRGYLTDQAQIIGIESRTSSPVKIPRDVETLEHTSVKRLFPCGEGAGYAGGIMSAAMDGERCAEKIVEMYSKKHHE